MIYGPCSTYRALPSRAELAGWMAPFPTGAIAPLTYSLTRSLGWGQGREGAKRMAIGELSLATLRQFYDFLPTEAGGDCRYSLAASPLLFQISPLRRLLKYI